MNKFHILSVIFLIIGIALFLLGFLSGNVETGFFIVFPFITGSGIHAFLGFIFIFVAILLFMFGYTAYYESNEFQTDNYESKSSKKTSIKGGGVVLIGPIPIVIASNWKIAVFLMILAIIIFLLAFFSLNYL